MTELIDVEPHRRADVMLDAVSLAERSWGRKRPRAIGARDGLIALQFEAQVVWVSACNIAQGVELSADDLQRLTLACSRIDAIFEEAVG